jgi:transcriptional regulator of met regulon
MTTRRQTDSPSKSTRGDYASLYATYGRRASLIKHTAYTDPNRICETCGERKTRRSVEISPLKQHHFCSHACLTESFKVEETVADAQIVSELRTELLGKTTANFSSTFDRELESLFSSNLPAGDYLF